MAEKKYKTAAALKKAIDGYITANSYQEPAIVVTPTGEVDENGQVKYAKRMLTDKMDGTGKPLTVTKYLDVISPAGLLLHLGIGSKSTWSEYRHDKVLAPAVEYWDLRYEAYLSNRLETGKHIAGVMFALEHHYGWKHKQELSADEPTRRAMAASSMTTEEKMALLQEIGKEFGGSGQ